MDGLRELRREVEELRDEVRRLREELGGLRERIARLEAILSEMKYWLERCNGENGGEEGNGDRIRLILFIILVLLSLIASVMGVELPFKK